MNGKKETLVGNLEKYLCIVALSVMLLIVFGQVVNRYVFSAANRWSEELARYLNVLVVYLSCAYGIRNKDHIKIDVMILVFPRKIRPVLSFAGELLVLVFFAVLAVRGFIFAASVIKVGRTSSGIGINMGYLYLLPPIGFALSTVRLVENMIKSREKE